MNNTNINVEATKALKEWALGYASLIMRLDLSIIVGEVCHGIDNGEDIYSITVHNEDKAGNRYNAGTHTVNEHGEEI